MKWQLQIGPGRCESTSCQSPEIHAGEPVRLVMHGRQRWCKICAFNRLFELPPAAIAPPAPTRISVSGGRIVAENFSTFDRQILTRRQLEHANAIDPKLRQLSGADR